jgi:hypothetical protein
MERTSSTDAKIFGGTEAIAQSGLEKLLLLSEPQVIQLYDSL